MSSKHSSSDRSLRKPNGELNGSVPLPPKIPTASRIQRTSDDSVTSDIRKPRYSLTPETFERAQIFVGNFSKRFPSDLASRLCTEFEIGGGDAARYDLTKERDRAIAKDQPLREEARNIVWGYAEGEASWANAHSHIMVAKHGGNEASGYIVRDAFLATVVKDLVADSVYNALMKRWIEVVGNDDIMREQISPRREQFPTNRCKDCGQAPDEAWKKEGGQTDDNIWATCTVCRKCWVKFSDQESKDVHDASSRENYSDPY
jgi:hypothetical protein